IATGYPFDLIRIDTNRLKLRVEIQADGGYSDYDFASSFVYLDRPSIAMYVSSGIALSVSSRGNLGYADYPENGYGIGVMHDNQSFLFEGGFIAATTTTRIVSNVRGANGSVQDRDFIAQELPSDSNAHTLTIVDAGAGEANEIGLELRVQTLVGEHAPNAFATRVRARNIGAGLIDSLRLGMFADWDLAGEGDGQSIVTRDDAQARVPLYAVVSGQGYFVSSGAVAPDRAPILFAIENGGTLNIYQNFNHAKKYHTLSNGVGARTAGPADVSLVTGRVLTSLERDDEDTVLFVVGIGTTESEAVAGMQAIADLPSGIGDERTPGGAAILSLIPNPAITNVRIAIEVRDDATLALYDALGGLVVDLTNQIPHGGSGFITFDASHLATGIYVMRASDTRGVASQSLVIVR
ncbi:MAG: T9SS type A sorting domain-containing protein, partial [bacterium]|nr:T9SS type A sorting domain-containing protein [Candidatus Kapabacteria bacterium]